MKGNWGFVFIVLVLLAAVYIVYTNSPDPWDDIERCALIRTDVILVKGEPHFVLFYDDPETEPTYDAAVVYKIGPGSLAYIVYRDRDMWVKWDAVKREVVQLGPIVPEKDQGQAPRDSTRSHEGSVIPPQLFPR